GWTEGGMVRAAAFKGLREDKPARAVAAEPPMAPGAAAGGAPALPARAPAADADRHVLGIAISKPEKVLWPAAAGREAVTKLDLARYLEAVGTWAIVHLKGRPCSVIRAPDGIEGQRFFQRHAMLGISKLVTQTRVEGDRQPYVQIDSVEALIAMAQIAALEYHPWNCQPFHPTV